VYFIVGAVGRRERKFHVYLFADGCGHCYSFLLSLFYSIHFLRRYEGIKIYGVRNKISILNVWVCVWGYEAHGSSRIFPSFSFFFRVFFSRNFSTFHNFLVIFRFLSSLYNHNHSISPPHPALNYRKTSRTYINSFQWKLIRLQSRAFLIGRSRSKREQRVKTSIIDWLLIWQLT
jgi:hypothetical protein